MKQSTDLEISPRSSTVASRERCRVAMYVKCSEDSERKATENAGPGKCLGSKMPDFVAKNQ